MSAINTTAFGEAVDPIAETDGLFLQLIHVLSGNEAFERALTTGQLTDEAKQAIADSFEAVFERNRRLADIILSDREARQQFTAFWFARSYAEVQAHRAYTDAFRRAALRSRVPASDGGG